jgi:hypothetical protein
VAGLAGQGRDSFICGVSVGYDVQIVNGIAAAGTLHDGGLSACGAEHQGSKIGHDLVVQNNANPVDISNNQIVHDLAVRGNTGGVNVTDNHAGHDAVCQNNHPAATGSGNTAGHDNSCPS